MGKPAGARRVERHCFIGWEEACKPQDLGLKIIDQDGGGGRRCGWLGGESAEVMGVMWQAVVGKWIAMLGDWCELIWVAMRLGWVLKKEGNVGVGCCVG